MLFFFFGETDFLLKSKMILKPTIYEYLLGFSVDIFRSLCLMIFHDF